MPDWDWWEDTILLAIIVVGVGFGIYGLVSMIANG
jgi:hypothetical protein